MYIFQVCIIELGGTIGDIEGMPFVEAFRQLRFKIKPENFCLAHVSLIPQVIIILSGIQILKFEYLLLIW